MTQPAVTAVHVSSIDKIELPGGSWSRVLLGNATLQGHKSSLGYSRFEPGTVLGSVRHEAEELAYVVKGTGELRLENGVVPFKEGDALHIPAGVWHAVANTGTEAVEMVFVFSYPDYPPTEKADG